MQSKGKEKGRVEKRPPFPSSPPPPPIQRKIPDWKRLERLAGRAWLVSRKPPWQFFIDFKRQAYTSMQLIAHHIEAHPSQYKKNALFLKGSKGGSGVGIKDINYSGGTDKYIPHFWNFVFSLPSLFCQVGSARWKRIKKKNEEKVSSQEKEKKRYYTYACWLFLFSFSSISSDRVRSREGVFKFWRWRWCGCPRSSEGGIREGSSKNRTLNYYGE